MYNLTKKWKWLLGGLNLKQDFWLELHSAGKGLCKIMIRTSTSKCSTGRWWIEGIPPPTPHTQWRPGPSRAAGWYLSEYLAQHLMISLQLIYTALHCQLGAWLSTYFIVTVMAVNVFNTSVTNENLSRYLFISNFQHLNAIIVNLDMKCCLGLTAISSHKSLRLRN